MLGIENCNPVILSSPLEFVNQRMSQLTLFSSLSPSHFIKSTALAVFHHVKEVLVWSTSVLDLLHQIVLRKFRKKKLQRKRKVNLSGTTGQRENKKQNTEGGMVGRRTLMAIRDGMVSLRCVWPRYAIIIDSFIIRKQLLFR